MWCVGGDEVLCLAACRNLEGGGAVCDVSVCGALVCDASVCDASVCNSSVCDALACDALVHARPYPPVGSVHVVYGWK